MMQPKSKCNLKKESMAPWEAKKVRLHLFALSGMGVALFLFMFILNLIVKPQGLDEAEVWWASWFFMPTFFVVVYIFAIFKYWPLPFEYKNGSKVVLETQITHLGKFGFSDVDASEPGGMPQMLFGSVFYLYVKDPTRRSGQRKFRIKKNLYDMLRPGDEVTIGYLPRTCMMFYLNRGSFHYEPTRRVKGT